MTTEQSTEFKKISLLIEAWHNAKAGFEELLQGAKKKWAEKEEVLRKYGYDEDGYPRIKEARENYFNWIDENISKYGIAMSTNCMSGEPVGLFMNLAGTTN